MATPLVLDAQRVRELRAKALLTMDEVSEQAQIARSVVSRIEQENSRVQVHTVRKLTSFYGVTSTDLLAPESFR